MNTEALARELSSLMTEQRNPRTIRIDLQSTHSILLSINAEDKAVAIAVEREIPYIAQAVEIIVDQLKNGGRLIYVGAGTSGRIGVVDASECPPTFGTPPGMVRGIIAGGDAAMFKSQEGSEDDIVQAARDMDFHGVSHSDVVCGIAASRRTPYVVAAVERARSVGAKTLYVTTNPRSEFNLDVDVAICPEVGPEVLLGSTRMKSGTAQKLVLNMLTTAAMIKLGKVYENMMVDLQLTNAKLVERAKRIVMMITGIEYQAAEQYIELSGGHVKTAVVMAVNRMSRDDAERCLAEAGGFVRLAVRKGTP